jgi:hypothetical protein
MPSNYQGDGSTLDLDFTTGVLDSRLTFSRAGGGTYVGADGYIYGVDSATSASLAIGTGSKSVTLTATAGVDRRFQVGQTVYFSSGANNMSGLVTAYNASTQVITINATATTGSGSFTSWFVGNASPRFDYSPTNIGEPRGLLIEGQTINYMLYSTALNPHSTFNMRTIATASITDPEGTTDKARIVAADGTTGYHVRFVATTAGTNTTITISIFARKNGYKYLHLADGSSGRSAVLFDLDDGTTSNSVGPGFVSATATSFNGWWRCSMVVNVTASTSYAWGYVGVPTTDATLSAYGAQYTGANTDTAGIYCYGFQVEAGAGASSLIPTGASGVTRNADSCVMTGTNFSSWYSQGRGTVVWTGSAFRTTAGHLANINTVNNDPRITAYVGAGALTNLVTNGTTQASTFFGSITANTAFKAAWRFDTNNFAAVLNNGTVATDTSGTVPTGVDRMQIGAAEGGYQFLDGWVKSIKYYPTALDDSALKATTI